VEISIAGLEARRTHLEELAGCFPVTATQVTTFDDYFRTLNAVESQGLSPIREDRFDAGKAAIG
jgi:hypothetical protein